MDDYQVAEIVVGAFLGLGLAFLLIYWLIAVMLFFKNSFSFIYTQLNEIRDYEERLKVSQPEDVYQQLQSKIKNKKAMIKAEIKDFLKFFFQPIATPCNFIKNLIKMSWILFKTLVE